MSTAARRSTRPRFVIMPVEGDRVCLFDAIFDALHDHGTIVALRDDGMGPKALVAWDEDTGGEAGWCDLAALDIACPTRRENTRGNHPRSDER